MIRSLRLFTALLAAAALTGTSAAQQRFDEPPVPVRTVAPEYPPALKREGVSGMVSVAITVDEKGNVSDARVERSSHEAFEKPAVDAVSRWRFKPATKDGAPVAVNVVVPVRFNVN
jgi:protein TonB